MKITHIKSYLAKFTHRNLLFVIINTDENIDGIGECTATHGVGSSFAVEGALKEFAALLNGQNPFNIENLVYTMRFESYWALNGGSTIYSAISGIEQALWDIKGKVLNVPVYELLGGRVNNEIRLYANNWPKFSWNKPQDYAKFALEAVKDGFTALKIYPFGIKEIVKSDQEAIDRVEAVRDVIGSEVDLMVDGGWRYSPDILSAIRVGKKLEKFDLLFLEEPIAPGPGSIDAIAKVTANVDIPIAAGERIYSINEFREYLDKQAVDIIEPDVGVVGGIFELKKIVDMAKEYHVQVAPHNASGPVATAATMQVNACTRNLLITEIFPYEKSWHSLAKEAVEDKIKNGYVKIFEKPGLGIEINEELILKYV